MIIVPLWSRGKIVAYAEADDRDTWLLSERWIVHNIAGRHYAERSKRTQPRLMHRAILGLAKGDGALVDHIDGNTLNNRRSNLRIVTTAQNAQNQGSRGGTSDHRGVSWCRTRQRWLAQVQLDGRKINLGRFRTEQEARRVVQAWRAEHMPYSQEKAA